MILKEQVAVAPSDSMNRDEFYIRFKTHIKWAGSSSPEWIYESGWIQHPFKNLHMMILNLQVAVAPSESVQEYTTVVIDGTTKVLPTWLFCWQGTGKFVSETAVGGIQETTVDTPTSLLTMSWGQPLTVGGGGRTVLLN